MFFVALSPAAFFILGLTLEGLQLLRCLRYWGRALLVAGAGDGGSSRAQLAPPAAPSVYDGCTAAAAAATGGGAEMAVALFFYSALRPPPLVGCCCFCTDSQIALL